MRNWVIGLGLLCAIGLGVSAATTPSLPSDGAQHCATCTGATPCKACKNCNSCAHCKKEGGTCGACKPKSDPKPKASAGGELLRDL